MAYTETPERDGVNAGVWQGSLSEVDSSSSAPPPWLAASVAEFRRTRRILDLVRPIRAAAFGGILVFATLLAFLLQHSPVSQSTWITVSLFGLPICLAAWYIASSAQKRLSRTKNHIEQRVYGAGMHVDDHGRVVTDNPHPILIFDPATRSLPNMS